MLEYGYKKYKPAVTGGQNPTSLKRGIIVLSEQLEDAFEAKILKLHVFGNFSLYSREGLELRIKSRNARTLLMMLATARDMRRSRSWLRTSLWPDAIDEETASQRLRTLLTGIRKDLGDNARHLRADRSFVWLEDVEICEPSQHDSKFFEDAPVLEGEASDWLYAATATMENKLEVKRTRQSTTDDQHVIGSRHLPWIVLLPATCLPERAEELAIAERITDMFGQFVRQQGFVTVYDARDVLTNQLSNLETLDKQIDAVVQVHARVNNRDLSLNFTAKRFGSGEVIWSSSIAVSGGAASISNDQLIAFVHQAIDSTLVGLFKTPSSIGEPPLYALVHQLFSMSTEGVEESCRHLSVLNSTQPTSVTYAWQAFSLGIRIAERMLPNEAAVREEAELLCSRALEGGSSNPIVVALVGHVYGFILRNFEVGRHLLMASQSANEHLPFPRNLLALNLFYSGEVEKAYDLSISAQRMARFNPIAFWYDSVVGNVSAVHGDHQRAIHNAQLVKLRRPRFLTIQRHALISLVAEGRYDEATDSLTEINRIDRDFTAKCVLDPSYPLPQKRSRYAIHEALKKLGKN